jgi:hypothetical protein
MAQPTRMDTARPAHCACISAELAPEILPEPCRVWIIKTIWQMSFRLDTKTFRSVKSSDQNLD